MKGKCGERKWANGWRKIPLLYGAIIRPSDYVLQLISDTDAFWKDIRFTSERHLGYYIVYCRRGKKTIIITDKYEWYTAC